MGTWSDIQPEHVREVIDTSLLDGQIEGSIATAVVMISDRLVGIGISNSILTEITRYVSAHLVSIRDNAAPSSVLEEKIGDASIKYNRGSVAESVSLMGLQDSRYGQVAIMLDPTGTLGSLGGKPSRLVAL